MTIVNSPTLIDILGQHSWFRDVAPLRLAALAQRSRMVSFDVNETIFSEGQAVTACLLVCSGSVQGVRYTADGDDKVFGQVGPGGWLSVLTLFEDEPRHLHTVRGRDAGHGCLLHAEAFRQLCLDDAAFACGVLKHSAKLIHHHTDQIDWLTSSGAEERLAEYILRAGKPQEKQAVQLPLSHAQIAVKLGMRAETLSRIFAKWRREGYISEGRGQLLVLRLDVLKRLASA